MLHLSIIDLYILKFMLGMRSMGQKGNDVQIYDPHATLGLHELSGKKVIRLWRPGADGVHLEIFGKVVAAKKGDEWGMFEYVAPANTGERLPGVSP